MTDTKTTQTFKDLLIWQRARSISVSVYADFGSIRDFGFRDQICRAAVSVMNNIAEGFDRGSKKDFVRFLYIAKGSIAEVRSMIALAEDLGYLNESKSIELHRLTAELGRMIGGYIRTTSKNADL